MTDYEYLYTGVPRLELAPEDELIQPLILELFNELQGDDSVEIAASAVHYYERKNERATDSLGGPRNQSYGSSSDDVILQLTMRVNSRHAAELIERASQVRSQRENEAREVKRRELDKKIQELQALRDELD